MDKKSIQKYIQPLIPIPTSLAASEHSIQDIRCLLFDIYGTLFISGSGDISLAEQNSPQREEIEVLLRKYGITKTAAELLDKFHGAINARHIELRNRGIEYPEVRIERIWQQVLHVNDQNIARQFAVEFELIANPVYPMPNLADLLATCRHQGLLMGLISNAQFYTPFLFDWFLDSDPPALGFSAELIFFSYRHEMAKPSAALFELAAAALKKKEISRASVLYLGNDMLNDIYPAHRAGFKTALFAGDRRSLRLRENNSRCHGLAPDLVVTDLSQLTKSIRPQTSDI